MQYLPVKLIVVLKMQFIPLTKHAGMTKPHSVALPVMTRWCKDWCVICALIVDIVYDYWNKESLAENHAHLCNWPRWKDCICSWHRDDSKHKTFFIILCFWILNWILNWHSALLPPPTQTTRVGFGSQETAAFFPFVTVPGDRIQEWVQHCTIPSLTVQGALNSRGAEQLFTSLSLRYLSSCGIWAEYLLEAT